MTTQLSTPHSPSFRGASISERIRNLEAPGTSLARCAGMTIKDREHHMSFYDAVVPAYLQMLGSLSGILTKAEAHCSAKNIQPEVLLGSRLFPDMLPLSKQIQLASDFAAKGCARLTHKRGALNARHRKDLRGVEAAAGADHRLCEGVQTGAVGRRA